MVKSVQKKIPKRNQAGPRNTKAIGKTASAMDMVSGLDAMETFIMDPMRMTRDMAMGLIIGPTGTPMMDHGKLNGLEAMAIVILDPLKMTEDMDMDALSCLMATRM